MNRMYRLVWNRTCHLWLAVLAALPLTALAQQAPPTSGQLLQQLLPPPQSPPKRQPGLTIEQPLTVPATETTPFAVRRIELNGNTIFTTATLHALIADGEGRTLTLAQLQALAQRITDFYRAHGYPLARAVVPAQTLSAGVVRLRVIEARYSQIRLDNRSRVRDGLLQSILGPLQSGALVDQGALDRQLLLLNDLPGVHARAALSPGAAVGTSDLVVQAEPAPLLSGNVGMDDEGNRYTGRARVGANVALNDPLGLGDQFIASAMTSGHDMDYGRLAYELAVDGLGTRVGAAYSALGYQLGHSLADLRAHGTAGDGSLWVTQPFVRSPDDDLSGRLEVDDKRLHDDIDTTDLHDDRHIIDWTASMVADRRDTWGGGGIVTATLGVTRGHLGFDDAAAKATDAATTNTRGAFTRWDVSLSRLQSLTATTRLYLALSGQYSSRNLDSAEQFLLGGPDSVRGYAVSTLAGASGYLVTAELRHDLGIPWAGQWQGAVFVDNGGLWVNPQSWPTQTGSNHATLTSAGLGLNWAGPAQWLAKLQVAQPVDATPELAGRRPSTQGWIQISKGF
jgi:hemolysin activation/secretion protein